VTRYEDLPREAQRYVAFLEEVSGVPVSIVSTGSGRRDTIVRDKSAAAEWFGVGAI
jgi:adenylosuccinate synthase